MIVTLAVEGHTDASVLRRVLDHAGLSVGPVYVTQGKAALDRNLLGYNEAARFKPWLAVRDLNSDEGCAPELARRLLPSPAPHMRLRIAVRAVEAWLLADDEAAGRFLGVARSVIPRDPENLINPKLILVNLARRSRRRAIRDSLVPRVGTSAIVGPGYTSSIIEFARDVWRPEAAAVRSQSLARLLRVLRSWT